MQRVEEKMNLTRAIWALLSSIDCWACFFPSLFWESKSFMVSMATINLVYLTSRTFISQVRDNWVLFAHSHTQSGPLPQLHHRVSSSAELWSDFTAITPALKLPWPGFHIISSCQRNGCSRWGSLSFSTCECRQTYQSPLVCWERIFIADNMCILFITFLQNFYVLILFSNHIIFQRIGKSGNLLSLINEKYTL